MYPMPIILSQLESERKPDRALLIERLNDEYEMDRDIYNYNWNNYHTALFAFCK